MACQRECMRLEVLAVHITDLQLYFEDRRFDGQEIIPNAIAVPNVPSCDCSIPPLQHKAEAEAR